MVHLTLGGDTSVLKLSQIFELYCVQIITHKTDFEKFGKCNGSIPPCPNSNYRNSHHLNVGTAFHKELLSENEQKSNSNLEKSSILEPKGLGASTLSGMHFPCKMSSTMEHAGPSPKYFQRFPAVLALCPAPITKTLSQI